ncbi:hypothetical protein N7478_000670 [Penicillium angulare]|uniref:uncharacterized protein n=1 Tax=Penicillium angulare TaxID=116970 RepID=UPI002542463E|nr:uncharacterized protein N7478_000670 [Penicillium angulare]KAJ5291419.1 hypothetical protein N7478_000670 [Penicillium angulare]
MLLTLPPEILLMILDFCNRKEVLKNLCLVSKALHLAVTPRLYRSLTLRARNEGNISDLAIDCLLEPSCQYIEHTRDVILTAEFHELLFRRCHDYASSDDGTDDEDDESSSSSDNNTDSLENYPERVIGERTSGDDHHEEDPKYLPEVIPHITEWSGGHSDLFAYEKSSVGSSESSGWDYDEAEGADVEVPLENLESRIQSLLGLLPEAKLKKFSWSLGTCVPEGVIEYLILTQSQITCLEIVTDSTCLGQGHLNICDLHGLKALRRIRWIRRNECSSKTPGKALRANALALEEIEIDEVGCRGIRRSLANGSLLLNQY